MKQNPKESELVLDILRSARHDGPGLRTTVFLKGCALSCAWCHNPESQSFSSELMYNRDKCMKCGKCLSTCEHDVHHIRNENHIVSYAGCVKCGKCETVCPVGALSIYGRSQTCEQVFQIVKRDRMFYDNTGGGMTLSGGEPLLHENFCHDLLLKCREENIHSCVETSAYVPAQIFRRLAELPDLFLFDYKLSDKSDAMKWIGADLELIQSNLHYVLERNKSVILRCPVIPDVNDSEKHFDVISKLVLQNSCIIRAEILPYHNFGVIKGENIGKSSQYKFRIPGEEAKEQWMEYFKRQLGEKVCWG